MLEDLEAALAEYLATAEAEPESRAAPYNAGNMLRLLGRTREAVAAYEKALARAPNFSAARFNRAYCLLQLGEWTEGFREYEWRKATPTFNDPRYRLPNPWRGEELGGKTLFIYPELYQGDLIQFSRYAILAERLGAKVILAAPTPMHALLRTLTPTIRLVEADATPSYDYHVALMSLPLLFGTTPDRVPAGTYLKPGPERVAAWRQRIGAEGFKIGLVWQGSDRMPERFFPLAACVDALGSIPGVRLISLQKFAGLDQLDRCPSVEMLSDFDTGPDAFLDTAAAISCCNLFVTADTSTAHVAGAIGAETWLAVPQPPDWRWLENRNDTPWYPSMRLFRQRQRGNWDSVFSDMAQEVRSRLGLPG